MIPKRRTFEVVAAVLFAVAILAAGGVAIYIVSTMDPTFDDPVAVPSTAAEADTGPYAGAIESW